MSATKNSAPTIRPQHRIPHSPKTMQDYSSKSVFLYDWWLVKPNEEKGIAIAGKETKEERIFCSAPICNRIDTTTLETTDGRTVTITGLINRHLTHKNGYPFEVCNGFLIGFPYNWKDYVSQSFDKELTAKGVLTQKSCVLDPKFFLGSGSDTSMPVDLSNLSAIKLRDFVMHLPEASGKPLFDDILGKLWSSAFHDSQVGSQSEQENRGSGDGMPRKDKKREQEDNSVPEAMNRKAETLAPRRGVVTRSMSANKRTFGREVP